MKTSVDHELKRRAEEERLRRRAFKRPAPRVEAVRSVLPLSGVKRPAARAWPMVPVRNMNGSRVPAARVLEGPMEWLALAARDVDEATDGRYMLLVEGTRVEMNTTLAMGPGNEFILGF